MVEQSHEKLWEVIDFLNHDDEFLNPKATKKHDDLIETCIGYLSERAEKTLTGEDLKNVEKWLHFLSNTLI